MIGIWSIGTASIGLAGNKLTTTKPTKAPTTEAEKISYALGVRMGEDFQNQGFAVDVPWFAAGMVDSQRNKSFRLSEETMSTALAQLKKQVLQHRSKAIKNLGEKNKVSGKTFLDDNLTRDGVKQLPSGLQYRIIQTGKGKPPSLKDRVRVEYTGRHLNGKVFDSTKQQGKPVEFPLSEVILGWQEGLQKMHPGAIWELYIPPHLAYGARGIGALIEPNETLVFTIHLLEVKRSNHH